MKKSIFKLSIMFLLAMSIFSIKENVSATTIDDLKNTIVKKYTLNRYDSEETYEFNFSEELYNNLKISDNKDIQTRLNSFSYDQGHVILSRYDSYLFNSKDHGYTLSLIPDDYFLEKSTFDDFSRSKYNYLQFSPSGIITIQFGINEETGEITGSNVGIQTSNFYALKYESDSSDNLISRGYYYSTDRLKFSDEVILPSNNGSIDIDSIDFNSLVNISYSKEKYGSKNAIKFNVDLDISLVDDFIIYATVINKFVEGDNEDYYDAGYVINGTEVIKDQIICDFEVTSSIPFYLVTDYDFLSVPLQIDIQVLRKSDFKRGFMKQYQVLLCNSNDEKTGVFKETTTDSKGDRTTDFDKTDSLNNNFGYSSSDDIWDNTDNAVSALKKFFSSSSDFLGCITYFFNCLPNWLVYPFIFMTTIIIILAVVRFIRGG